MTDTIRSIDELITLLSDSAAAHSTNRQLIRDIVKSLQPVGSPVYDASHKKYGLKFDGTDETSAFIDLLEAAHDSGGGDVVFPAGKTLRADGQILIPNDGAALPTQRSLRLTGGGASTSAGGTYPPFGGPILDLRYDGGVAKILTKGHGSLEVDHLTLTDGGTSTTPFFQTTNTTVDIHNNRVEGNSAKSGVTCDQDAFILGGTDVVLDGSDQSKFDGYTSKVHDNCFSRIRRGVYGQKASNAITIRENWFLHNCGSNLVDGAAIEFLGGGGKTCTGNLIFFNTIEVGSYPYGIKMEIAVDNHIVYNGMFDPSVTHIASVRMEANARYNYIIDGYRDDTKLGLSDVGGTNTFITSHQSQSSILPQPQEFQGIVKIRNKTGSGQGLNTTWDPTGDAWDEQISVAGSPTKHVRYIPSGLGGEEAMQLVRASATDKRLQLMGSTNNQFQSSAQLRVLSATGTSLFLGDTVDQSVTVLNGQLRSSKADGTQPFVITSTTPVNNLSVKKLGAAGGNIAFYGAAESAKPTITGSRGGNAAVADLLTKLATLGLITDSTSA